jgi:hypothetical protein
MSDDLDLTRRQLLGVAAGAVVAAPLLAAAPAPAPSFLTKAELTLLDELTELIIPTDDHSPGARAAKVAAYIDRRLAEAFDNDVRARWRAGLKAIDAAAQSAHSRPFMACSEDQRIAVLTKLSDDKDKFFGELKANTVRGYYTSEIGIHKEMEYKGNTLQDVYAGIDVSK